VAALLLSFLSRFYLVYVCFTPMFLAHPVSLALLLFILDYRHATVILSGFEGYFCCHYCSICCHVMLSWRYDWLLDKTA